MDFKKRSVGDGDREDQALQPKRKGRTVRNVIRVAPLLLILFLAFLVWFDRFSPNRPVGDGSTAVTFEIEPGSSSYSVAKGLEEAALIGDARFFRWMIRIIGKGNQIKTGFYDLNDGLTSLDIITMITEGRVSMTPLTIPEGWNNRQIGDYLAEKGYAKDRETFLRLTRNREVLRRYNIPADTTEGYLFPDTYMVPKRFALEKIQDAMLRRFFKALEEARPPANLSAEELHKKVILASIIEREAAHPDELPVMSQVFQNRLEKKMRLESCATVQYLLPKPREKLYDKDLLIQSPYNTYLHRGMPPGPISNPGLRALTAAFHPEPVPYLFFVLKPNERRHHFSTTFNEHVRAKKKYLGE